MHAERPPNRYSSIQSNSHQNNFKIKLIDDADVVRERYDMANEDNLSMAVERRYLDEHFKDRLYSLPASFPVLKQQIIDMPVFEVDEIDNLGDGIMLGQIPLFDQSAVVRIQVLDDDPLKLLRAPHEAIKKLNIYKQRIGPENSLLNDKILNKALKDEKITEVLARISPISSSKTPPPVITHHQIPFWRPTLLSLPHFLRTQLQHICRHGSNTGIYSSAQLSSMTASSIYIDMHASAYFSPQLISRSIDDLECDGMLARYSMKLEEVGEFTMLDRLADRSIHIVSATLNGMTAISSTVSLSSCTNMIDIVDLNLGHNHLQKFEALGVLKKLRILNLESNKITRISPLKSDTLIKLCLANNQISIIEHLDGLPHLKDLDLSGNMITAINNLDGLHMLEVLDMSRNRLQRVSGLHLNTMLTKAVLYGNQISAIDDWDSIFLEDLSLSENSLTSIDFKLRCPRLQTVNLRSNRLTSIRYAATWSVGRLTSLQLAYNPLHIQDIISCCSSFVSLTDLVFTAESDMDTRAVADKLDKVLPRLRIINELRIGPKTFENNQMLEKLLLRVSEFGFSGDQGSGFDFLCRQEYKSARPMQRLNYLLDTLNQLQNRNHFLWRLIPSAKFVKQRLSKFIKLCPMPKRKLIYDLMPAILKGETSFRTSLLTSTKDLAKIEQESKIKLSLVRKFLLNVMQRRRERKRFLATKISEIVTIQKNLRGWLSRRLWSHKKDPLYFHKNHINKIVACQKLIRGFITRRRFKKYFANIKFDNDIDMEGFDDGMFDDIKLPAKPVFEIPSQLQDLFKNNFQANQPAQEWEFNKAVPQTKPLPFKPTPTAQTPKITTQMGSTLPHAKGLPPQRTPFHATLGNSKHSISSKPSHVISHRPILQPIDHRHDNKIVKQSSDSDMQSIRSTSSRMFGINTSDSGASRHDDDDTSMTASESRSRQSSKLPVVVV